MKKRIFFAKLGHWIKAHYILRKAEWITFKVVMKVLDKFWKENPACSIAEAMRIACPDDAIKGQIELIIVLLLQDTNWSYEDWKRAYNWA